MRTSSTILVSLLLALLLCSILFGAGSGAVWISPGHLIGIIGNGMGIESTMSIPQMEEVIFWKIRLPRVLLAALAGGGLALSGMAMQGMLRNPLAAPGIIGLTSGASLSAALYLVLLAPFLGAWLGAIALPLVCFLGTGLVALVVYRLSRFRGRTSTGTLVLAGIAIQALASAMTGFVIFLADDSQLRGLTFWLLGSMGGSTWQDVAILAPFVLIPVLILPRFGRAINAFSMGEDAAALLGFNVERTKLIVFTLGTLAVGATISFTGTIGFVGLIVPHIIRVVMGPDNGKAFWVVPIAGAILLILADTLCRTIVSPQELPIGILTAVLGAPIFLQLLLANKKKNLFAL